MLYDMLLTMRTVTSLKAKRPRKVEMMSVLDSNVKALRLQHRLTLRDIAKVSGLTSSTISRMEHGCEATLTSALKLAQFFETTVDKLFSLR